MADEKTIILKVELDTAVLTQNAKDAEAKLSELVPKMKEIRKEQGAHSIAYKEVQQEVKKYNKVLTDSVKSLAQTKENTDNATGSLTEMKDSLKLAKTQYASLSQTVRDSDVGKQMAEDITELKGAIDDVEKGLGTFKLKDFVESVEEASASNRSLTASFEEAHGDIQPLSGRIGEMEDRMYELALANQTGTQEFKDLQEETAKYRRVIIQTDASVDQLAEQGKLLGPALSIGETAVAGYQAMESATALLGSEQEELLEVLTRLQATQSLLQSIEVAKQQLQKNAVLLTKAQTTAQVFYEKAVGNSTGAMKGFRLALVGLGIGAIIVGIALLVEHWEELSNIISGTTEAQKINNQVTEEAIEKSAEELSAIDKVQKKLSDTSLSREEQNQAIRDLQEEYPDLLKNMDIENASLDELNKKLEANSKLIVARAKQQALASLRSAEYEKQLQAQIELEKGVEASVVDYIGAAVLGTNATQNATLSRAKDVKEAQKQINIIDKLDDSLQKEIASLEGVTEAGSLAFGLGVNLDEQSKQFQDALQKRRETAIAEAKKLADKLREVQLGNTALDLENERKVLEAHYKFVEDIARDDADELLRITIEKNASLDELETREREAQLLKLQEAQAREVKEAKGNKELLEALEEKHAQEVSAIQIDFQNRKDQRDAEAFRQEEQLIEERKKLEEEKLKIQRTTNQEIAILDDELALQKARGTDEELEAWKQLQEEKIRLAKFTRDELLRNEKLSAEERTKIQKESELEIRKIKDETLEEEKENNEEIEDKRLEAVLFAINTAQQLANTLFQIHKNQLQKELNASQEKFDTESGLLQEQLDAGLISQAEFDGQKSELQAQFDSEQAKLKEEQFKKDKASQIINATIATAVGVATALASPPPTGLILAGVAGALGSAQIALIASQPTPKFKDGGTKSGKFGGNLHSHGGTKGVFDDGTQVEVEKDEVFVVLNRGASKTLNALSNHNQAHGGVPLMRDGGVLKMQTGGIVGSQISSGIEERQKQNNFLLELVGSLPSPRVEVDDITNGIGRKVLVENSGDIG